MKPLLISLGLSELQAETYLFLINHGAETPPKIATNLHMTRSNAYKVLDSLEDLGLVSKSELNKKFVYQASEPTALATLVAEKRNQALAMEHNVQTAIRELNKLSRTNNSGSRVELKSGKKAMLSAYEGQTNSNQPIHFIKTRADIPFMGFEPMDKIRRMVVSTKTQRFGITPDATEAPINPVIDKQTNLHRTWMPSDAYTSPVEWTVSGDQLLIQVFDGQGRVIEIRDQIVADSFQQLWKLIDSGLKANPNYRTLPRNARREI